MLLFSPTFNQIISIKRMQGDYILCMDAFELRWSRHGLNTWEHTPKTHHPFQMLLPMVAILSLFIQRYGSSVLHFSSRISCNYHLLIISRTDWNQVKKTKSGHSLLRLELYLNIAKKKHMYVHIKY